MHKAIHKYEHLLNTHKEMHTHTCVNQTSTVWQTKEPEIERFHSHTTGLLICTKPCGRVGWDAAVWGRDVLVYTPSPQPMGTHKTPGSIKTFTLYMPYKYIWYTRYVRNTLCDIPYMWHTHIYNHTISIHTRTSSYFRIYDCDVGMHLLVSPAVTHARALRIC